MAVGLAWLEGLYPPMQEIRVRALASAGGPTRPQGRILSAGFKNVPRRRGAMRTFVVPLGMAMLLAIPIVVAQADAPIVINSRDDWLRYGLIGSGTAADPFIVQQLRFDATHEREVSLSIRDVPDHAVIREVLIVGGKTGILVKNAPNVQVENITVRRAQTAMELVNVSATRLTLAENSVGIAGTNVTITNSIFSENQVALQGTFMTLTDSRLTGNPEGYVMGEQKWLAPKQAKPRIERVLIEDSLSVAISAVNDLVIANVSFDRNGVGIRYVAPYNNASVTGSNFGEHRTMAMQIGGGNWKFDAKGNFWGRDVDGEPTEPSPFGRGPPILGPIDYLPVATGAHDSAPRGPVGASFANTTGPNITDVSTRVFVRPEGTYGLLATFVLADPDGIASWTVQVGDHRERATESGLKEVTLERSYPLAGNTSRVIVTATDMFANVARFNATYALPPPTPPPPVDEDPDAGLPPPPPAESPAGTLPGLVAAVAAAAWLRTRRASAAM